MNLSDIIIIFVVVGLLPLLFLTGETNLFNNNSYNSVNIGNQFAYAQQEEYENGEYDINELLSSIIKFNSNSNDDNQQQDSQQQDSQQQDSQQQDSQQQDSQQQDSQQQDSQQQDSQQQDRILLPVRHLSRLAHPARREAARTYSRGILERRALQKLGPEQRHDWILRRLRVVVRRAAEVPYYGRLFKGVGFDFASDFSFDDFAGLPVLERDEMRRAGKDMISERIPREWLVKDATGGSTGSPPKSGLVRKRLVGVKADSNFRCNKSVFPPA